MTETVRPDDDHRRAHFNLVEDVVHLLVGEGQAPFRPVASLAPFPVNLDQPADGGFRRDLSTALGFVEPVPILLVRIIQQKGQMVFGAESAFFRRDHVLPFGRGLVSVAQFLLEGILAQLHGIDPRNASEPVKAQDPLILDGDQDHFSARPGIVHGGGQQCPPMAHPLRIVKPVEDGADGGEGLIRPSAGNLGAVGGLFILALPETAPRLRQIHLRVGDGLDAQGAHLRLGVEIAREMGHGSGFLDGLLGFAFERAVLLHGREIGGPRLPIGAGVKTPGRNRNPSTPTAWCPGWPRCGGRANRSGRPPVCHPPGTGGPPR